MPKTPQNHLLTLGDYKKIRTPFVFFDETGSINDKSNRFFALGIVKCMQPHYLDTQIRLLRQRSNFHDELKWNKISKLKVKFVKQVVDSFFETPGMRFSAMIINKDEVDFVSKFKEDPYRAYQCFSEILLKMGVGKNEVLIVLADYITTPKKVHFEVDIKRKINAQFSRLAIAGVHRVDSQGTNMLQINDILLGAVIYDYKLKNKMVGGDRNKKKVLNHIKRKLEISSFVGGLKSRNFRVTEYLDNKKGPSS